VILPAATSYLRAGLCVLPAILDEKRPAVGSWKAYQQCLPAEAQIAQWFSTATACCLLTGGVSGNLEMIDFDAGGALFDRWAALVEEQAPGLLSRLVIERSRRGGKHVVYRCRSAICGNLKLAQRQVDGGRPETLIETRGEGGLFLCAPSPGYELLQGDLAAPPLIEDTERDILLSAAWSLNECWKRQDSSPMVAAVAGRPGDDFNDRGDVRDLLQRHGWTLARSGENEYWRRPGKDAGSSATLKDRVFYVFSSNAAPFEPQRAYAPFTVYALLEGFGQSPEVTGVDLSAFSSSTASTDADDPADDEETSSQDSPQDPGPVPNSLLQVPGFIDQVMEHCLKTAPHPNHVMAFCGAMALQALLAGRKVRDEANNRTGLYLLGLANSGVGKDHPRKVNQDVLLAAGMNGAFANTFVSGEGLEDRMFIHPASLFQTDEIDNLLASIGTSRESRYEGIMNMLLRMYTSADAVYVMRVKAGKAASGVIDQPCLCLFGTAIPKNFYQALSVKMLDNGFFARMIVLEAGARSGLQPNRITPIPQSVLDVARWWSSFRPGTGNLESWHPQSKVVDYSEAARGVLLEHGVACDEEYRAAEGRNDTVAMAIWARANEKARRLALVYACSENHAQPLIGQAAAQWASLLVTHQTKRMLFMASEHVSESEFDADCKKVIRTLREWRASSGDAWMPFWRLSRKLPWPPKHHDEVRAALLEQKKIDYREAGTGGRRKREYHLR
jgi:hypothetical protein